MSGLGRQGQGDHHALAHAARELVRVVVDALFGGGMPVSLSNWMARWRASAAFTGRWARMVS